MEKFYMEELQDKKNKKKIQKKGLHADVDFSVALSFIVAAFALFSVASFGIINNQSETVSYAAPTTDTFTMVNPYNLVSKIQSGDEAINVPVYYAGSESAANRVFCVEMRKALNQGTEYTKSTDLVNDAGLLYILSKSIANGKSFTGYTGEYKDDIEVWAAQSAIWLYLAEKYPNESVYKFYDKNDPDIPHLSSDPDAAVLGTKAAITSAASVSFYTGSNSSTTIELPSGVVQNIVKLVNDAKNASGSELEGKINLSASEEITKTSDGKYYQTGLISVVGSPADAMSSYTIKKVDGIADVKIVDENGNDLALTNIPAGKKFYARIPIDKVTEAEHTLRISVVGNFTMKSGVYYTSGDSQKVVALKDETSSDEKGIEFDIVGAPDTGMNTAQTIYFIGLIVLLCGVGIVYANTKPVESKQ